jgi:hypothetical protein
MSFDLNINNYNKGELEEILELPIGYDENILNTKANKLREKIANDNTIDSKTRVITINFIKEVENKLAITLPKKNKINIPEITKEYYNLDKTLKTSDIVESGNTYIIKQPITPHAQSLPSEFFQGTINPLTRRILRQNINIDTRFRDNYYKTQSTNFHLDLPIRLTQVVSLQLTALELPTTYYTVSKQYGNNYFVIEIRDLEPLTVTLPDGNYDFLALQNYINNFLSSAPGTYNQLNVVVDVFTPNGTTGGGTGKMVIGSKTGDIEFSLNFQTDRYGNVDRQNPLPLKLGWKMGFREGYYSNNTSYVSEGLVDILGLRYIYLVVDDYNKSVNDGFYGAFNSSVLNKNILARISLQGSVFNIFSQSNYNLITSARQYFGPVDIQKLHIQLLDEYGRVVDLNNMDYSFSLTFQAVYDL